jgi:TRAP-type C4-dicarboxylate transport system substrate-binding protein
MEENMKIAKCTAVFFLGFLIVTGVFAGGGQQSQSGGASAKAKIKFGNTQGEGDTQTMALREVAKRLNESGLFEVEVFINSSLGDTDDMTEQAILGSGIVPLTDPSRLASFVHDFGIINMPYILKDHTALDKLNNSNIMKEWEAAFRKEGIELLTSNWYSGARHFVTNNVVNTPADLKGQRIRTMGNDICIESVNAMGAVAVGMAWSEVYPAIQQKSLDGAEVQTTSSYPTRLYEILHYTNKTSHFQLIGCAVTGTKFFNTLTQEQKNLLKKTFADVGSEYQPLVVEFSEKYEKDMAENHGMIVRDVDPAPFIEAVQPVYKKLGYEQLRTRILAEIGN